MLLSDVVLVALASFSVVWLLSFWYKTEPLREWLGVYFIHDPDNAEKLDRDDGGGLGGWINCPQCSSVIGVFVAVMLWLLFKDALVPLAGLGGWWWVDLICMSERFSPIM